MNLDTSLFEKPLSILNFAALTKKQNLGLDFEAFVNEVVSEVLLYNLEDNLKSDVFNEMSIQTPQGDKADIYMFYNWSIFPEKEMERICEDCVRFFDLAKVAHINPFGCMNVLTAHNFIQVRNGDTSAFERTKGFYPEEISEKLALIAERFPSISCFFQETKKLSGLEYRAFFYGAGMKLYDEKKEKEETS